MFAIACCGVLLRAVDWCCLLLRVACCCSFVLLLLFDLFLFCVICFWCCVIMFLVGFGLLSLPFLYIDIK